MFALITLKTLSILAVIVWLVLSAIIWAGINALRHGNYNQQMTYERTSAFKFSLCVLFAPVLFLAEGLKWLLENWHITCALALVVIFAVALTGCQTNVVTAPNSTFMVDSKMSCEPQ